MEVLRDCILEFKDFGNRNFRENFFGQLSPKININYQGQPWSKGIPYVLPVSGTECVTIAYIKKDRCDLE